MCQHHNHSYLDLVPLNRKMGWAPPGVGCICPLGDSSPDNRYSTLATSTLVLVSSVEVTLVTLVTLVFGTLVTRPMVILGLLVFIHQGRWRISGVVPLTVFITR